MAEVDDIQSFIAAQKKRIEDERAGLILGNVGRSVGNSNPDSHKITQGNYKIGSVQHQEQPKATIKEVSSPNGLPLGSYESVQERLRKERAEEYKKFLAEKNYRSTGVNSPRDKPDEKSSLKSVLREPDNSHESPRDLQRVNPTMNTHLNGQTRDQYDSTTEGPYRPRGRPRPERTLEELYDAYEELLERKRQDERRYRGLIDDPYLDSRRVRFDDESRFSRPFADTWLEHGRRRRWDSLDHDIGRLGDGKFREPDNVDARTLEDHEVKTARTKNPDPDRISRSAPSKAVPLLGERDMTPEAKQQRQAKYREELQAQMKEREMQKKREKNHMVIADQPKEDTSVKPALQSNQDTNQQRHLSNFPRQENPGPLTQVGLDRLYNDPYLRQPYNYPASLLASGAPMSTLNPSGMFGGYPMSLREPLAGYQPSWASGLSQAARTNGLVTSLGGTEAGDRRTENRQAQVTGVERGSYGDSSPRIGVLPHDEPNKDKSKQQAYREELTRQMMEKEMRKKKDKEAVERYNMKLEKEIAEYDPWGKSGGGAPIRDESGRLVSDLRRMHQYNKEGTIISPRDNHVKPDLYLQPANSSASEALPSKISEISTVATQDIVRPSIQTNDPQKKAQLEYQEYLRQQVEEKQRRKKEEEERLRELNAREDKIIEEQQMKLRSEYEKELEAGKKKEEAARLKNDEIRQAAEQKKKEMEQKRLEEDRKQEERLRKQLDERLRAARAKEDTRPASPPIPTLQGQTRSNSPPIPTLQRRNERDTGSSSPPIPTLQNQVRSNSPPIPTLQRNKANAQPPEPLSAKRQASRPASGTNRSGRDVDNPAISTSPATPNVQPQGRYDQETSRRRPPSVTADIDVLSQLTSLRRQLKNEEVKVQQQLTENKEKYAKLREDSGSRRSKKPVGNVFDNVLRKNQDLKSYGAMEEFNKLKYEDTSSLHGDFITRYPEPATSNSTLDLQQKSLIKEQQKRLHVFKDSLLTNDKENMESLMNTTRPGSKTSQLESDSQFVSVEDPTKVVVDQGERSKQSTRLPSARERRRWKQLEQLAKAPKLSDYKPPTPGGFSLNSVTSFNVDEIAQKNEERLRRLEAMKQARSENKGDPNEVLKKFIQQHSRPDSKVSEKSLPADKRHFPNM